MLFSLTRMPCFYQSEFRRLVWHISAASVSRDIQVACVSSLYPMKSIEQQGEITHMWSAGEINHMLTETIPRNETEIMILVEATQMYTVL